MAKVGHNKSHDDQDDGQWNGHSKDDGQFMFLFSGKKKLNKTIAVFFPHFVCVIGQFWEIKVVCSVMYYGG